MSMTKGVVSLLILATTCFGCSKALADTNSVQIAVMTNGISSNGHWVSNGILLNVPDMPDPVGVYGTNHVGSWGVVSNHTNNAVKGWRDDNQRGLFNAIHTNMVMGTNGVIHHK